MEGGRLRRYPTSPGLRLRPRGGSIPTQRQGDPGHFPKPSQICEVASAGDVAFQDTFKFATSSHPITPTPNTQLALRRASSGSPLGPWRELCVCVCVWVCGCVCVCAGLPAVHHVARVGLFRRRRVHCHQGQLVQVQGEVGGLSSARGSGPHLPCAAFPTRAAGWSRLSLLDASPATFVARFPRASYARSS